MLVTFPPNLVGNAGAVAGMLASLPDSPHGSAQRWLHDQSHGGEAALLPHAWNVSCLPCGPKSVVPLNECEQTVRSMVRECRAYTIVCNYKGGGGRVCHRCWCIWHEKPHANSPPNGDKTRHHDSSCQAQHRHTSIASEQHVPPSHLHRMSMEEYVGVGVPILGMPPLDILGHKMPHGYVCMYIYVQSGNRTRVTATTMQNTNHCTN